jgi:adenosine deaminase
VNINSTDKIEQFIAEIPKVELHLHLEGAIPMETLFNLIQRQGREPSIKTLDDLRRKLVYTDFTHFIEVWTWKNTFIKEEKDFGEIAYQVLGDLSQQNVKYVEAFYSPGDYWRQDLSVQGITKCLIEGKERAFHDFGIQSELIIDLIRDHGPERSMKYLEEVTDYLGKGVIGIGLGGSEQSFPADSYASVYQEARKRGFRLTAHVGEVTGADFIWTVVEKLGVERIGHGVKAYEDSQLVSFLKERQIPLEMCVISNVKTGACKSVETHPIKQYFQQGLMVTVNSDDPTMFNTSISQEYSVLVKKLGFTVNDLKRLSMNGIDASFMSEGDKKLMKSQFEKEWEQLLNKYC